MKQKFYTSTMVHDEVSGKFPSWVEPLPNDLALRGNSHAVFAEQTSSSDAFDSSDDPSRSFAEQTSTSDTSASSDTASEIESSEQTPTSETYDSFGTGSTPPPQPAPRPTPRSEWIGTTHARRMLGVGSENTSKAWIGYGYLRGRRLPNGRGQVLLSLRASAVITSPVP